MSSFLATLYGNQGLVNCFHYYASDGSGGAPGRKQSISVQEGEFGAPTFLSQWEYVTPDGSTYVPSSELRDVGARFGPRYAAYLYTYGWHPSTTVLQLRTTQLPASPEDQNGSGHANKIVESYDTYGNLNARHIFDPEPDPGTIYAMEAWTWDISRGSITSHAVDPAVLNLVTDFVLDDQGRTIAAIGPAHTISLAGMATEIRRISWTVYMDGAREIGRADGYLRTSVPGDTGTLVNPVRISKLDLAGRVVEEIQAIRSSTAGPISADDVFVQADYCRWSKTAYDDRGRLVSQRVYHHIPASGDGTPAVDYGETTYGYDDMSRRYVTVSPAGTISRTVYDTRGLVVAAWVGTNDTGATPADPSGGGAAGNNMVQVDARQYDCGAPGGNGWLTQVVAFTGAAEMRITTFDYDFRGRHAITRGENGSREMLTTNVVGEVTTTERWYDEGASMQLVGRVDTLYDDLGRRYRTIRYSVDPVTGSFGEHPLSDDIWYDPAGNVMKQRNPEDAGFEKLAYDGALRIVHRYAGYASTEPEPSEAYAAAQSVAADFIFEQSDYTYDNAGAVIEEKKRERFHNAGGMGALGDPATEPKARVLYSMNYPDPLGRIIASANYGTNGGTVPGRPDTVPPRSDAVLVKTTEYNARGETAASTDPNGTTTVRQFDDAGRLIKTIENFEP
jgi:YD repeat-containing protein